MFYVLYVDDEAALLEVTKIFLERSGTMSVDTAVSATDAIPMLKQRQYDAIIADYQMPDMDGIAFLKHIRFYYGDLPFILFTGKGREEVVIEALNNGANFYLQKGGEPRSQFVELEHKVRLAIEGRRNADELHESRQRMADIINFLPDATFAIDLAGNVIAWNKAMEEITGIEKKDILGTGDFSYAIPIYGVKRPLLINLVLHENKAVEQCYPYITRQDNKLISELFAPCIYGGKGAYIWFIASRLYDTKGHVIGAIESIRDITDRKKMETALKESEERYRSLAEASQDLIFMVDREGIITYVNSFAAAMLGKEPGAVIGKAHALLFPAELANRQAAGLRRVFLSGQPARNEGPMPIYGDVRWFDHFLVPVPDATGRVVSVLGVSRDITDRRKMETALKESEERYRNVVEDQTEFISRFLPDGTHIFVNEAYCRYFNKRREEIIGKKFIPEIPKNDKKIVRDHFASLSDKNPVASVIHRIIMPDGQVRWQRWSDRAIFDRNGTLVEYQSVGRDITDSRVAEQALQESEERYRSFVQNFDGIAYRGTLDFVPLFFHGKVEEITGYTEQEFLSGSPRWDQIIHESDRLLFQKSAGDTNGSAGRSRIREYRIVRRDGEVRWIREQMQDLCDPDGKPYAVQGALYDITEQKQAEETIQLANKKLTLLSGVTRHDILNKISALLLYQDLMLTMISDPILIRFVEKQIDTARLIQDQIAITKDYENIGVKSPRWQDVRQIVKKAISEVETGGIPVDCDTDGLEILADPLFERVFYNLFDNALRHGKTTTQITVQFYELPDGLILRIRDDGTGIPGNKKEKIFEKGYGENTGLGLFLVREILSITEISIAETGEPDTGAQFDLHVPRDKYRLPHTV
jgi:PAS domain S-box-containing protein